MLYLKGVSSEVRNTIMALWISLIEGDDGATVGAVDEEDALAGCSDAADAVRRAKVRGGAGGGAHGEDATTVAAAVRRIQAVQRGHHARLFYHEVHDEHPLQLADAIERMIGRAERHNLKEVKLETQRRVAEAEAKRLQIIFASDVAREEAKARVHAEIFAEQEALWDEEHRERKKAAQQSGGAPARRRLSVVT